MFKTIGVTSEQQDRNRREIETTISNNLNEVIDAFIPWKDISRAYFRVRETPGAAPLASPPAEEVVVERKATPMPRPVTFGDTEVQEFDDDSEDDAPPKLTLGEDIKLDDDIASVNTEDELEEKTKAAGTVSLNL
jgi:hypothetical protein